jgi:hypothetical protein
MIEALIHRIKIKQAEVREALAVGAPITWEAYQRLVGDHQGMQAVLDMIDDMLNERDEN